MRSIAGWGWLRGIHALLFRWTPDMSRLPTWGGVLNDNRLCDRHGGVDQEWIDDPLRTFRIKPAVDQAPVDRVGHVLALESGDVVEFLLPNVSPGAPALGCDHMAQGPV